MNITYIDRVFDGVTPDADGCYWMATGLTGWDSPPTRMSQVEFAMKDGAAMTFPTYGPRALTMTGVVKAPNEDAFWNAYNHMLGATDARLGDQAFAVQEGQTGKFVMARRFGEPRLTIKPGHFEFDLALTAPDPVKYGAQVQVTMAAVNGTRKIANAGNYPSQAVLLTSTADGTIRVKTDKMPEVVQSSPVVSGTRIDLSARTVKKDSLNLRQRLLHTSRWWSLLPGDNQITNIGSAGITLAYRPAWI